jgi:hypothetical protein
MTVDEVVAHATGAIYAFSLRMLNRTEYGKGGDGVVEVRFKNGKPLGVFIRPLRKGEPTRKQGAVPWSVTPMYLIKREQEPEARPGR